MHKNKKIRPYEYSYIQKYCDSIIKHDLNCVVCVDEVDNDFIRYHKNKNVNFELIIDTYPHMLLHDARFIYFLIVINNSSNEYFMLTDGFDVEILNPIQNIINVDNNTIYVCKENDTILNNKWFLEYIQSCEYFDEEYNDYKTIFLNKIIINCGAIFCHKDILIEILKHTINIFHHLYSRYKIIHPTDMFVFNYVIYK